MSKKFLIVGGVAGGASTAARLRRLDEKAEIIIFERGRMFHSLIVLSFHLSGIVENSDKLILMTPQGFQTKYNIEARVQQEVVRINREQNHHH